MTTMKKIASYGAAIVLALFTVFTGIAGALALFSYQDKRQQRTQPAAVQTVFSSTVPEKTRPRSDHGHFQPAQSDTNRRRFASADKQPQKSKVRRATLVFIGDLMANKGQLVGARRTVNNTTIYDFSPSFTVIAPYLKSADLAIANLETTLSGPESGYTGPPQFNTPDSYAIVLKNAGIDLLNTANNHCMDRMVPGLIRTKTLLRKLGFKPFGTRVSAADSGTVVTEVNGIRFAFAGYTFSTNGITVPPGQSWAVPYINEVRFRRDAAALRHKADIVVAVPHLGVECVPLPPNNVRITLHKMLDAGFDWVIASHPHVVQPFERFNLKPLSPSKTPRQGIIAWSLGNFISSARSKPTDIGSMLFINVEKTGNKPIRLVSAQVCPTWIQYRSDGQVRILPMAPALSNPARYQLGPADQFRLKEAYADFVTRILGQSLPPKLQTKFEIPLPGTGPNFFTPEKVAESIQTGKDRAAKIAAQKAAEEAKKRAFAGAVTKPGKSRATGTVSGQAKKLDRAKKAQTKQVPENPSNPLTQTQSAKPGRLLNPNHSRGVVIKPPETDSLRIPSKPIGSRSATKKQPVRQNLGPMTPDAFLTTHKK